MSVSPAIIGNTSQRWERRWTVDDSLLYALAVGAGQIDPVRELSFTTENSADVQQQALPSFLNVLAAGAVPDLGPIDLHMLLHGEQSFAIRRPLPAAGALYAVATVKEVWDKGSGAVIVIDTECVNATDDGVIGNVRSSVFIRGAGGFGGPNQPSLPRPSFGGEPDHQVVMATRPEQALLYRLTGDHNPLHSDPAFARKAGFSRPVLHGMCTYGYAARALINTLCDGDASRLVSMSGRFSRPVFPGDTLTTSMWVEQDKRAHFQTLDERGDIVLDRGVMTWH